MSLIYNRQIRVTVGNVTVENLVMHIDISKEASGKPNDGNVTIFNLNESTETLVREPGQSIRVEAGYGDAIGTVFFGDVRDPVERDRQGLNRLTKIRLGGHVAALTESTFMRSYAGQVPVRTIVADALRTFGLLTGPIDSIPATAVVEDFAWGARTAGALDRLLEPLDIQWFEEDGIVKLSPRGRRVENRVVVLNAQTGLIETPSRTDKGIKAVSVLNPDIRIGGLVRVQSESLEQAASGDAQSARAAETQGLYKVTKLAHRGDNWDGEFVTEIQASPVSDA